MGIKGIRIAIGVAVVLSIAVAAGAQSGLKTINPSSGGKIVYGQVDGQTTEAGAMGAVLHSLHQSLGEKPQVGKLFQVHGTESVAVFFSVTRHDQGPGKPPLQVGGLLIATKVSTDHVEAALVTDDASRFQKTLPGMMKTLMGVWHPLAGAGAGSGGGGGPVAPLKQVVLQDRSASISLPEGWKLSPTASAMGTIVASGPNGEMVSLGLAFLAADTNNPRVQQTMRTVQAGGLRNTVYATALYYPYGGDPGKTFVDVLHHAQQRSAELGDAGAVGAAAALLQYSRDCGLSRWEGHARDECALLHKPSVANGDLGQPRLRLKRAACCRGQRASHAFGHSAELQPESGRRGTTGQPDCRAADRPDSRDRTESRCTGAGGAPGRGHSQLERVPALGFNG
jgi:hypothetical protein